MITRRINVRGIVFKDGKILAQQLLPDDDGKERDYWCLPGGGLEAGESLQEGLFREMIEETGITPKIGDLLFIQQFNSNGSKYDEQIDFIFNIENVDDYESIDLSKTSHGLIELQSSEFIDPKDRNILPKFLKTVDLSDQISKKALLIFNNLNKK